MSLKKNTLLILLMFSILLSGQSLENQKQLEKIYTQTDRPLYMPEETIWFKTYITDGKNQPTRLSEILHAQLISPEGNIAKQIKLSINQGYSIGDFHIQKEWPGGIYKLRTYTNMMISNVNDYFEKEIIIQKIVQPRLLMTLDFEKTAYGPGSDVQATLALRDLQNRSLPNQKVEYQIKIAGRIIQQDESLSDSNGDTIINFELPPNLNTTDAILNIQIPYQGSRESISKSIPVTLNKIDLQFMPESGTAIQNNPGKMAFKAINEFGKPVDVAGEILDQNGTKVVNFESAHDGMGWFNWTPRTNKYFARLIQPVVSDSLIPLPETAQFGTSFTCQEKGKFIEFQVFSNNEDTLLMIVENANSKLLTTTLPIEENKATFQLPKQIQESGIVKTTLINKSDVKVAERLLFLNPSNQLDIQIDLEKSFFKTREKVHVEIKTLDQNGFPVPSNLSLAITDNNLLTFVENEDDHILSQLLVSSELSGKVHNPQFYFNPEEEKAFEYLDLVMLTHGWRTYLNHKNLNNPTIPERLNVQYGRVTDITGKPVKAQLLLFDPLINKVLDLQTDESGYFSFQVTKNSRLLLMAYTKDAQPLRITKGDYKTFSQLTKEEIGALAIDETPNVYELPNLEPTDPPLTGEVVSNANLSLSSSLDQVVVVGYSTSSSSMVRVTTIANYTIKNELYNNYLQALQGLIPGVQITAAENTPNAKAMISLRGISSIKSNTAPLLVVDGFPINADAGLISRTHLLDFEDIYSLTVIKGASASAMFGEGGTNGVIIVNTKKLDPLTGEGKVLFKQKKFNNYSTALFHTIDNQQLYSPKAFYMPVYQNTELSEKRTDFRKTLYWNPVIQTDINGRSDFDFYTSDELTSFAITTEGIGVNGLVGRDTTLFATNKPLGLDLKLPSYLTLNDTLQLPIRILNTTNKSLEAKVQIDLPNQIKLLEQNDTHWTANIPSNSYNYREITVTPTAKTTTGKIKVSLEAGDLQDRTERPIQVLTPYFPAQNSWSGLKSGVKKFDVGQPIPGTLKAELIVYTNIIGETMDGIASILREPHGCFEQVSSTTYPNILVLKYLRETETSYPKVEAQALAYIKKGYKKLAAYETSQNGFEWYGDTPPHEALSAYGLMEFMEMQEVYNGVDQQMLKRTKEFLLNRRDGRGGFKQNHGKYGFSAAPQEVNNAYITYVLGESGFGKEVMREYQVAKSLAIAQNDSYRLAMLALFSMKMNLQEDRKFLMKLIKDNIDQYGFGELPVTATITRSNGNAMAVETAAFTVMALSRDAENPVIEAKGIEYIVSQRRNGKFGNTQSTSMALKALIEYTKKRKQLVSENLTESYLFINDKKIFVDLSSAINGKVMLPGLEKYMSTGVQDLSITFADSNAQFPFTVQAFWNTELPQSAENCDVQLKTNIQNPTAVVGETFRIMVEVENKLDTPVPMTTAKIGIPSGSSLQLWQLKELLDKKQVDYYEIFDQFLVLYWREMGPNDKKTIFLDLKTEIPGTFNAPASSVYLYYTDEFKNWQQGVKIKILAE
ncbi:MG2 domain-containing protein [Nonlabens xiamenensis]|uniref:MG2 domain-containing protein n=1 Tax=Nonlabens xiamenensis TaxID=2341043 RepID=UPI000F61263C|nr:MG2 domain-containing protein [Nonlabens xiamenensis]